MRPAGQIWRPTAAQTFFEGEEEYFSWSKSPHWWSSRSQGVNARAPLKVRLNRHYRSKSPLVSPSAIGGHAVLNEFGINELSAMAKNRPTTGPMRTQPIKRDLIVPTQPTVRTVTKAPHPKRKPTRTEAVRAAKAKMTRLGSLRKQREALKGNISFGGS